MNGDLRQQILAFLDELTEEQRWAFLVLACAVIEAVRNQREMSRKAVRSRSEKRRKNKVFGQKDITLSKQ